MKRSFGTPKNATKLSENLQSRGHAQKEQKRRPKGLNRGPLFGCEALFLSSVIASSKNRGESREVTTEKKRGGRGIWHNVNLNRSQLFPPYSHEVTNNACELEYENCKREENNKTNPNLHTKKGVGQDTSPLLHPQEQVVCLVSVLRVNKHK